MVKQYGELYLELRRKLLAVEEAQNAGTVARLVLSFASGKTPEAIIADRDLYASEKTVEAAYNALNRLLTGEPLPYGAMGILWTSSESDERCADTPG